MGKRTKPNDPLLSIVLNSFLVRMQVSGNPLRRHGPDCFLLVNVRALGLWSAVARLGDSPMDKRYLS
jgi:hypothetical protein